VPTHTDDDGSRLLLRLIHSLQSVLRRRAAAVAAVWATAGALAALAALLAIDWSGELPPSARSAVYGATGAAAVAVVAGAAFAAWRRKPSSLYVARLIETERPQLKNALLTFVELVADPSADPSMTSAVGRRAAAVLARDVPGRFLPPWEIRRPVIAVLGAAALVGGMLWLAQGTRIRPWVASAEGGLMGVALEPDRPSTPTPRLAPPAAPKASPSDATRSMTKETAERGPADAGGAGGATKAPAAKASPTQGKAEAATAQALAGALQADAKAFERLAAALADDGATDAQGGDAGGGRTSGTGAADGPNGPQRSSPVSRQARRRPDEAGRRAAKAGPARAVNDADTSRAVDNADPSPRPDGTGAAEPSPDAGGEAGSETVGPRAGGGAAGTKPRKAAGDSPLPDREPSDRFPKNALDAMRRAKRLIEEADRRLRDGEVTDTFLGRMGVGNAEFRRFVVAWQRRLEAAGNTGAAGHPPREVRTDPGKQETEVLRPAGGTEATPIVGPVNAGPDGRKGSVQGASPQVSPRLQPAVKAYFETVDQLTAEPGEKEPSP